MSNLQCPEGTQESSWGLRARAGNPRNSPPEIRWNPGRGSRNLAFLPGHQEIQGNVNGPVAAHLVQRGGLGACHWLISFVLSGHLRLLMPATSICTLVIQ